MSQAKPWYRKFNNTWYVQIGKRQIALAKGKQNRRAAFQRLAELLTQQDITTVASPAQVNFVSLCEAYLDWVQRHQSQATYVWYRRFLQEFCNQQGLLPALQLKPFHVTRWLETHEWSDSTRRAAITAIKRVLNWGLEEGYIDINPLRGLKRPATGKREVLISDAQHQQLLAASDTPFRNFLIALHGTGARPGEVSAVTAADVDLDRKIWILKVHKTARKTAKPRVILLTGEVLQVTTELIGQHPTGPLFRNQVGKGWTPNAIRCRMRRLRDKLKLPSGIVAYAYRHTYATNGLANGVPVATMAELLGHSDTKMISAHYGHLSQRLDHLQAAAEQVHRSDADA